MTQKNMTQSLYLTLMIVWVIHVPASCQASVYIPPICCIYLFIWCLFYLTTPCSFLPMTQIPEDVQSQEQQITDRNSL